MSYTEIFKFKKDGEAECFAEIKNAYRGAMAIWNIMDEKYLPPLPPPPWLEPGKRWYRMSDMFGDSKQQIWDLFKKPSVTKADRIALGSTFDNVVVYRSDVPVLTLTLRLFSGETSLVEQADAIDKMYSEDPDFIAIAWNQTSVNCDTWISPDEDDLDEDENRNPYNILKHTGHWNLFESLID